MTEPRAALDDDQDWWIDDSDPPSTRPPATGRVLLLLAPLTAVVGVLLVVIGSAVLDHRPYGSVAGAPSVAYVERARTVLFDKPGTYLGYVETPQQTAAQATTGTLTLVPLDSSARVGRIRPFARDVHYDAGGRHGRARWTFRIEHTGVFQVQVTGNAGVPGATMTFGRVTPVGLVAGVALVLPGALLLVVTAGLVLVGVLLRRRRRTDPSAGEVRGAGAAQ